MLKMSDDGAIKTDDLLTIAERLALVSNSLRSEVNTETSRRALPDKPRIIRSFPDAASEQFTPLCTMNL
jgi:hypothetical protein